jgi:hypothetical protein
MIGARPAVLCVIAALMLSGCAGVRPDRQPVVEDELEQALSTLAARARSPRALRASGEARLSFSGRTLKTTFAALYERPGWLRADLRPSYGSLGASLNAQALVEEGCARVYFPAKLVEVTGCLSDVAVGASALDPAALVLGLPDVSLIDRLEVTGATRQGATLMITGRAGDATVSLEIDERLSAFTRIEIEGSGPGDVLTLLYEGYGWRGGLTIPRTVTLSAFEGTTREIGIEIRYERARSTGEFDRTAHALSVPPGAREVHWRDLGIWR